jgi:hypothetical protein
VLEHDELKLKRRESSPSSRLRGEVNHTFASIQLKAMML